MNRIDYRKFKDDKAEIGTLAHQMVEDHLLGVETDFSDYSPKQRDLAENSFLSWLEWEKQHPIKKILSIEMQLVSEKLPFGGTNDVYCAIDHEGAESLEIIDLKTGKGIYREYSAQVAALKFLAEEHGMKVGRCRIINIPRTEDEAFLEKVIGPEELEKSWKIFQHCLKIYHLQKEK